MSGSVSSGLTAMATTKVLLSSQAHSPLPELSSNVRRKQNRTEGLVNFDVTGDFSRVGREVCGCARCEGGYTSSTSSRLVSVFKLDQLVDVCVGVCMYVRAPL